MLRDNVIRSIASSSTQWQGAWADGTSYVINDLVEHNGNVYIAITNHVASSTNEPGVGVDWETNWDLFLTGGPQGPPGTDGVDGESFIWRGQWVDSSSYIINDVVYNNGSSYIATADHNASLATEPGDGTSWITVWDLMASKGETGETGATGPQGPQGPQGLPGADGVYSRCDELILEMEMAFKTSNPCYYKEFIYNVDKQLTEINIYTDSTSNVLLFSKVLTYNAEKQLIQIDLTRSSDGAIVTSSFTYNVSKQLISIEKSGYCYCSSSSSSSVSFSSSSTSSSSSSISSSSSSSSLSSSSSSSSESIVSDSTALFSVASDADDGFARNVSFSSGNPVVGEGYAAYLRFTNVTIPQGATINDAYITVTQSVSESGAENVDCAIYARDHDNSDNPTIYQELLNSDPVTPGASGWYITTANVAWDNLPAPGIGSSYSSPDITSVIQEVVDRGGWSSGNALCLVLKDTTSSASHTRQFADGDSANPVVLFVSYTS